MVMGGSNVRHRVRLEEPGTTVQNITERDYNKFMKVHGSLPAYSICVLLVWAWGMFSVVNVFNGSLPTALTLKDEAANPKRFIADRAWNHLLQLTNLGPKVTGSYENEVLAVDFLLRELNFINQQSHPNQRISVDVQKTSGSYQLTFMNSYSEVQNIVVRLHSATNSTNSLLINCHFDTVPYSPGASDDGLNCVVMLEVLRVLSRESIPLPNDVIFLFNGAEEAPLKASHGFITQHKWADTIKAFINLEACGAGGREILFQAGPQHSWLVKLYAESVPYPHGLVVAEDIFQSGLVPSDTDFRVFRDFGHIPGLDFAHAMNGYVYHTKYDSVEAIPRGTVQHTGDNLLALVKAIASSSQLANADQHSAGRAVYYDIVGFFMIYYSEQTAIIINIFAIAISVYSAYITIHFIMTGRSGKEQVLQLALSSVAVVAGWALGAGAAVAVATLLDVLRSTMSWFTHTSLMFGLYYLPTLTGMATPLLIQEWHRTHYKASISPVVQVQMNCSITQLLWTLLLLLSMIAGIRSGFTFMLMIVFPALTTLLLRLLCSHKSAKTWLVTYSVSSLVPIPFTMYLTQLAFGLFIPIMGRIGPDKNPDLLIALLAVVTCILSSSYLVPLIVLVRDRAKVAAAVVAVFLLVLTAAVFTPIGFPFRETREHPTPQRVIILHAERTVTSVDGEVTHHGSGYWLFPFDRHNVRTVRNLIPEVEGAYSVSEDCKEHLYCALPVYWSRMGPLLSKSLWVPAAAPVIHSPASLELKTQTMVSVSVRRLAFTAKGVDNMAVFLSPSADVRLVAWSFSDGTPKPGPEWLGRPLYFIHHASGTANYVLQFWFEFEVPFNNTGPIMDIGIAGHYLSDKNNMGEEFKKFCEKYPSWAHVTAWTATVKLFKY